MSLEIITNHVYRDTVSGFELTAKERKEFDWMNEEEIINSSFVRFKGWTYYIGDFMRIEHNSDLKGWDGYSSDTFFSGVLIKLDPEDGERVLMGTYFSSSDFEKEGEV